MRLVAVQSEELESYDDACAFDVDGCGALLVVFQVTVYSGSSRRPFKLSTNSASRAADASYER